MPPPTDGGPGPDLAAATAHALAEYREKMDDYRLHLGIAAAFGLVRAANSFVDETKPWALSKAEGDGAAPQALDSVLGDLVRALGATAAMLAPFMPSKAREIWIAVGGEGDPPEFGALDEAMGGLAAVRKGDVLFPRPE